MDDLAPTILCVDDDPEILETLGEYLTRHGYQVATAANGVEALFQVTRRSPRAVILDIFMPRLGGIGALDRIKRLDGSIAIVLMSGVPGALEMVEEAGVSVAGVLAKPFDPAQLLGLLVEAGLPPPTTTPGASAWNVPRDLLRPRVLLVDDEPEFREILAEFLQSIRCEVAQAAGGEEALRRIPEFRPDLVLLDIVMPGLSGVETLRRIRALPRPPCVVMVSGIEDLDTARRTLALGASDYVTKPVDFGYLRSVLETHTFLARAESDLAPVSTAA